MNPFLWNIFLAVIWAFASGDLTLWNLAIGFVLAYIVLWLAGNLLGSAEYSAKVPRIIEFTLYFMWELLLANLRVAHDVLTPTHYMRPGIVAMPLDAQTDLEITVLANVISLTPGTLAIEVSPDRRTLYIHMMYIREPRLETERIKAGVERRLLEVLR